MVIEQFYIDSKITDYFDGLLKFIPESLRDTRQSSLSSNCYATVNLLDIKHSEMFYNYIDILISVCKSKLQNDLQLFYLHMVDYKNGGEMKMHNHSHNEDYSFILYLNTCDDGETVLHIHNSISIRPEKNKVLMFSSKINHSANYSNKKRILVGGLIKK